MDIKNILNQAMDNFKNSEQKDPTIQTLLIEIADKINKSPLVSPQNKIIINDYLTITGIQRPMTMFPSKRRFTTTTDKNILLTLSLYFITDLNKYDFYLINYALNFGLNPNDVINLLFLNNIRNIDDFCKQHKLYGDKYFTITTLKKLSALHKVNYNF